MDEKSEPANLRAASWLLEVGGEGSLTADQLQGLIDIQSRNSLQYGSIMGSVLLLSTLLEYGLMKNYFNPTATLAGEILAHYPLMFVVTIVSSVFTRIPSGRQRFKEIEQLNEHAIFNQKSPLRSAIKFMLIGDGTRARIRQIRHFVKNKS